MQISPICVLLGAIPGGDFNAVFRSEKTDVVFPKEIDQAEDDRDIFFASPGVRRLERNNPQSQS